MIVFESRTLIHDSFPTPRLQQLQPEWASCSFYTGIFQRAANILDDPPIGECRLCQSGNVSMRNYERDRVNRLHLSAL
jgi:hypothetical protein